MEVDLYLACHWEKTENLKDLKKQQKNISTKTKELILSRFGFPTLTDILMSLLKLLEGCSIFSKRTVRCNIPPEFICIKISALQTLKSRRHIPPGRRARGLTETSQLFRPDSLCFTHDTAHVVGMSSGSWTGRGRLSLSLWRARTTQTDRLEEFPEAKTCVRHALAVECLVLVTAACRHSSSHSCRLLLRNFM